MFLETSYELYQNDEHTFEKVVKDWFRHGAQRLKNEKMASAGMLNFRLSEHFIQVPRVYDILYSM